MSRQHSKKQTSFALPVAVAGSCLRAEYRLALSSFGALEAGLPGTVAIWRTLGNPEDSA